MAPRTLIDADQFVAADWARARDDASFDADEVMSGLANERRRKMADAERRLRGLETTVERFKRDGRYTAERLEVHRRIIEHYLSQAKVEAAMPAGGEAPTLVLLGGRGGSGKSWFKGQAYDPDRCIVLDADDVKSLLPEYEGWNAAQVYEESGDILDALLDYCRSLRLNVVVDATMKTLDGALTRVETFKAAGYRVEGHYMHLPRHVAARRAVDRFCMAPRGRYVPVAVILANIRNEANFDVLRPYLDAWSFWDNDVDIGESPRPISGLGRPSLRPP
jgi:predicted ABC-type ATPase